MISRYTYKGLTWIDLESPTKGELNHIAEEYKIPLNSKEKQRSLASDLNTNSNPPFVNIVLNFPQSLTENFNIIQMEIGIIINKTIVVTIHHQPMESLDEFSKNFEINAILENNIDIENTGYLSLQIIKLLYLDFSNQLKNTDQIINNIKRQIHKKASNRITLEILNLEKIFSDLLDSTQKHKEIFNSLELKYNNIFDKQHNERILDILNDYHETQSKIDKYITAFEELHRKNNYLIIKKNRKTRNILLITTAILAFIILISIIIK